MKIHEYQAKEILKTYDVRVPQGEVCFSPEEAEIAAKKIGGDVWVVKAQIHAGGRGKGGGVKIVKSLDDVKKPLPKYSECSWSRIKLVPTVSSSGGSLSKRGQILQKSYTLGWLLTGKPN